MSEGTQEQMMLPKEGEIIWTEVATSNLEECRNFYSEIFGWKITKSENDAMDMDYLEADTGKGHSSAGMYEMNDEMFGGEAPPPHIMNYIAVEDVDASAAKAKELGATILSDPADIPGTGRMCMLQDPTGATFSLIKLNYDQMGGE